MNSASSLLSKREYDVLHLISREYTTKEIANRLFVSTHTVISHRRNLMRKLKAKNSAGIVYRAFVDGLLNE